jgi:hypothetical protein
MKLTPSFLIPIVFWITTAASLAAQTTAIVYVRTGDPELDSVITDLQTVVASLNDGGATQGYRYELVLRDTFTAAKDFNQNHPDSISYVMLVCHGTFDRDNNFLHLLRDTRRDEEGEPLRTPDSEVEQYFIRAFYCGPNGKINSAEVGRQIAQFNGGHPYRLSSGGNTSGTSPTSSGGAPTGGHWALMSYEGTYGYNTIINGMWAFVVVGYKAYYWVWIPDDSGGSDLLA